MFHFGNCFFTGNRESVLFFYIFGFAREIQNIVTAYVGCKGFVYGVYTVNKTFTAHVSGDYILYFSCKAKYVEKEYTFSIAGKKAVAKVKHYLGTDFIYTNQSASMHGGGSME